MAVGVCAGPMDRVFVLEILVVLVALVALRTAHFKTVFAIERQASATARVGLS